MPRANERRNSRNKGDGHAASRGFPVTQNVDLVVNDGAIPSVRQTVPIQSEANPASTCVASDQIPTKAFVLQSGAPTGCDPGDIYEGNSISPNDGHFSFTQPGTPSYEFDITTHYQCGTISNGSCDFATTMSNTNGTVVSGDTGFLTVTNKGLSTFSGTITLSGTSPHCGPDGGPGSSSDSVTGTLVPAGNEEGNSHWIFALAFDSSGCGGFTGTIAASEGQQPVPVGSGGTVHLLQGEAITQDITFPKGTKALTGETITDALLFEDCTTLNATLANGSPGNNPNFSGGSAVPAGTKFIPVAGGSCPLIINQCSGPAGPLPNCKDIAVPKGSLITLNSNFTADDKNNPAYLIASDSLPYKFDWANISNRGGTFYVPGCIKPPCGGGGGSHGLNGMEAMADLNQTCQLLTYTFSAPRCCPRRRCASKRNPQSSAGSYLVSKRYSACWLEPIR